jgi:hypothetical protein
MKPWFVDSWFDFDWRGECRWRKDRSACQGAQHLHNGLPVLLSEQRLRVGCHVQAQPV